MGFFLGVGWGWGAIVNCAIAGRSRKGVTESSNTAGIIVFCCFMQFCSGTSYQARNAGYIMKEYVFTCP